MDADDKNLPYTRNVKVNYRHPEDRIWKCQIHSHSRSSGDFCCDISRFYLINE